MKLFGYWTLFVALSISVVAAYYSIVGLAAIFAAALIPIVVMGSVLEVAKITTAVWLHTNWTNANTLIKTYLTSATIVLMLITSMGIFGFLSKAHIEQTAVGGEFQARIEQIEQNILTEEATIERNLAQIDTLNTNTPNRIARIQDQIDTEQSRIERILERTQPLITEQEQVISRADQRLQQRIQPLRDAIEQSRQEILDLNAEREQLLSGENPRLGILTNTLNTQTERLDTAIQQKENIENLFLSEDRNDIIQLQTTIGIPVDQRDGVIGPTTTRIYNEFLTSLDISISDIQATIADTRTQISQTQTEFEDETDSRLLEIDNRISVLNENITEYRDEADALLAEPDSQTTEARQQIEAIRNSSQDEIDNINILIAELRRQLTEVTDAADQQRITSLEQSIEESRDTILSLTTERFSVESEIRLLEAEVGPVKYIAQMIYGEDSDTNTLEKSVRIVILMLVFVFDPLAIVLVIAAITLIEKPKEIPQKQTRKRKTSQPKSEKKIVEDMSNISAVPTTGDSNLEKDTTPKKQTDKPKPRKPRTKKPTDNIENKKEEVSETNMVIKTKKD